ncbi:PTS sugar transporter subunit IIB [Tetragenococcus koreensis]|uniref:PTS sugar transporter subunit IIB n=1 Tax=Tetragenococcus koreensis TaxID=290335 RepID=UPI000F515232|nr:PTS sugar transporter subunit IIB [Tetragenococcus koreensis]MDN6409236.1 PTS sugar transporter subunit IIB [Tetragenococcus halophilus]MDN6630129.1 PTS sugar transporter subunit IIB [Staphylococcus equorum]MDN6731184.1 PTS sugar transporter subunit IIB [Atopostipes suicloacalis]AYW46570.1 PTS mannose/fructose/sorbose transporter subunit IIB [Tetragenococcus koreensis]MCF1585604.1 PTS sugar transporter subunit IIB [Tetragenococcus koreensis]
MIKELRVDDRLIHGQIALTWPKALGVNRIIVTNDAANDDKTQQMSLKMAVPTNVKALIRSVEDTLSFFENPKAQTADLMIIVNNIVDAKKLVDNLPTLIERVNIANVGRFDGIPTDDKISIGSSILLSVNEKRALDSLLEDPKIDVVHQIIPDNSARKLKDLIKKG